MNLKKLEQLPESLCQAACFDPTMDHYAFDQSPLWYSLLCRYGLHQGKAAYYQWSDENKPDAVQAWLPSLHIIDHPWYAPNRLQSLSNYYSSAYEPIMTSGDTQNQLHQLIVDWVQANPTVDIFDINLLLKDSPAYQAVIHGFKAAGLYVQPYFRFANWRLNIEGRSFNEYVTSLPSQLKNTLVRKQRKLDREVDWQIEIAQSGSHLERAIADYERIYAVAWQSTEPDSQFIRQWVQQSAHLHNWPRLGLLYINQHPVAAQIWFVKDQQASIFKLAFDPKYKRYSPGSVLTLAMIKAAIEVDQVQGVDYLTGNDLYKQNWMNQRHERWAVRGFNPRRLKGFIATADSIGRTTAKRILNHQKYLSNDSCTESS